MVDDAVRSMMRDFGRVLPSYSIVTGARVSGRAGLRWQLRKTREEVLAMTAEMVAYARSLVEDVEFSAEDALRSDWDFLAQARPRALASSSYYRRFPRAWFATDR
jgi:isopropylmalate/homocitrate/citramalate synthase